ncbi:MAG: tetratricopeptide repeat protein [Chloroflexota bacterium]
MAVSPSEDRLRIRRLRSEKAVQLAMQSRWQEAADVNRELLELFPEDVDSHNRLGKALMELGRYAESREAYQEAARLDPSNTIAAKNLSRLEQLIQDVAAGSPPPAAAVVDPRLFIEESGKTAVTDLVDRPRFNTIATLAPGDKLELRIAGGLVQLVAQTGQTVGQLEPKLAQRVLKLAEIGNRYAAAITSIDESHVRVIIREVFRHPSMRSRPSFPTQAPADIRSYTRDSVFRDFDEDEEEESMEELEPDADAADASMEETPIADDSDMGDER